MTPTYCIVPVRDQFELTRSLIWSLDVQPPTDAMILDNGSEDGTQQSIRNMKGKNPLTGNRLRPWLHCLPAPGGIYDLWDRGFARAKRLAHGRRFNALFLNNDVILHHQTIKLLSEHLRAEQDRWISYPDYDAEWTMMPVASSARETRGVFGDGGMFGPCFMLRGEAIYWEPLITDAAYGWWWGDNHLAECVELAGGKQVRVVGLPIQHVNEGTAQHYPELYNVKLQDRGRWITRHQRGFGVAP